MSLCIIKYTYTRYVGVDIDKYTRGIYEYVKEAFGELQTESFIKLTIAASATRSNWSSRSFVAVLAAARSSRRPKSRTTSPTKNRQPNAPTATSTP